MQWAQKHVYLSGFRSKNSLLIRLSLQAEKNPDARISILASDKMVENEAELYDGEKEGGDKRNESNANEVKHDATIDTGLRVICRT